MEVPKEIMEHFRGFQCVARGSDLLQPCPWHSLLTHLLAPRAHTGQLRTGGMQGVTQEPVHPKAQPHRAQGQEQGSDLAEQQLLPH